MAKKTEVPEIKSRFSKSDVEYIEKASKMMPFRVDIQGAFISVPYNMMNEAESHDMVNHLRNKFGLSIQSSLDDTLKDESFYPKFRDRPTPAPIVKSDFGIIRRGSKFRDTRENCEKQVFDEKGSNWIMSYIGDMRPNYPMNKSSLDVAIKHGILVRIG